MSAAGLWSGPNRRDKRTPQIEFCGLCGRPMGAEDLVEVFVEGLSGLRVCPDHGEFTLNPSFNDLGGSSQAGDYEEPLAPHSGENWTHLVDW